MHLVPLIYASAVSKISPARNRSLTLLWVLASLCLGSASLAQDAARWFQIEVSIFSNESPADRLEERWQADRTLLAYPENLRRLDQLSDLLLLEELKLPVDDSSVEDVVAPVAEPNLQQITRDSSWQWDPNPYDSLRQISPFASTIWPETLIGINPHPRVISNRPIRRCDDRQITACCFMAYGDNRC